MALTLQDTLDATNSTIISADNQTPQIELDYLGVMLSFLSTPQFRSFPVNTWEDGSPLKGFLQADSHVIADLSSTMYNVISGGILDLAEGQWLDFWGEGQYQETRHPAIQEVGYVWVTVASALTLAAGELTVGAGPAEQYTSVQASTDSNGNTIYIPAGVSISSGSYPFQARIIVQALDISPGSVGFVSPGAINVIVSPNIPGASVTNLNPDNTGAWELVHGEDTESDASYRARLKSKWPSIALLRGGTLAAWGFWITASDPKVARFNVLENVPSGGQVTIYIDPPAEVPTVDLFLNGDGTSAHPANRPLCTTANVFGVSDTSISITGQVYVPTKWKVQAQAAFETAVAKLAGLVPIGSTIYLSTIIGFIQASSHVDHSENVQLNGSPSDIVLGTNAVPVFADNLTWIGF